MEIVMRRAIASVVSILCFIICLLHSPWAFAETCAEAKERLLALGTVACDELNYPGRADECIIIEIYLDGSYQRDGLIDRTNETISQWSVGFARPKGS